MSDEKTAETLADDTTAAPISDIIDHDAEDQQAEETTNDDESGDDKPKEAEADKAGEKDAGEDDKPKKLSGAQRAKFREARLLDENAELRRQLDEATKKPPADKASEDKPPVIEDFEGDYFAHQAALTAYEARKAVKDAIQQDRETREASEREAHQAKAARECQEAHMERVESAREVIADFDEVMEGMKGVNVRSDVIEEIMSSENSAAISYHLAQNPDKLDAMNQMSSRELARFMGRLEATVRLPEAKKQTSAPAPLSSLKGGVAPRSADSEIQAYLRKTYGDSART